jgi:hypothetical protein
MRPPRCATTSVSRLQEREWTGRLWSRVADLDRPCFESVPAPTGLRNLEYRAIQYSVNKGKIDDALRTAGSLRTSRQRAQMIAQIVGQIGSNGTSQDVVNFLEQARGMLGDATKAENQEQMNALIAIATAFVPHDPKPAFDIVEPSSTSSTR